MREWVRYIDAVFPGQYGIPKPFYFFLTPSYWLGQPVGRVKSFTNASSLEVSYLPSSGYLVTVTSMCPTQMNELSDNADKSAHEAEPTDLLCGIRVMGLTKVYKVSYTYDNHRYDHNCNPCLTTPDDTSVVSLLQCGRHGVY